jgi:hypothetical protein
MDSKTIVYEGLTVANLEQLEYERDDLEVKCSLLYADMVKSDAEYKALELEHIRADKQLYEVHDQIDYINHNVNEDC